MTKRYRILFNNKTGYYRVQYSYKYWPFWSYFYSVQLGEWDHEYGTPLIKVPIEFYDFIKAQTYIESDKFLDKPNKWVVVTTDQKIEEYKIGEMEYINE